MNDFDQACRYAARLDPEAFLRWVVPAMAPRFRFREWLDTRTVPFPGQGDRTCDTVAALDEDPPSGMERALVVEFQTQPDPRILSRLFVYVARLHDELRCGPDGDAQYQVTAVVLNLSGGPQAADLVMTLPDAPLEIRFHAGIRTLRDESAAQTLAAIRAGTLALCVLPWVALMRGGGEWAIIEEWKALAETELDLQKRLAYAGLALVFSEVPERSAAWRAGLEGWGVERSAIMEECRLEGQAEGRVVEARRLTLRVLTKRFGDLPAEWVQRMEAAPAEWCERVLERALEVESLAELDF